VGELEALVREHPTREGYWAFLMRALYRTGRQADALAAYRRARRALVEELGIEPGRQLREAERLILAHDPSLDSPPSTHVEPADVPGLATEPARAGNTAAPERKTGPPGQTETATERRTVVLIVVAVTAARPHPVLVRRSVGR
jgi:DNA-binding SARP family transcriptional activator